MDRHMHRAQLARSRVRLVLRDLTETVSAQGGSI
jgi:hypothetical protein